MIVLPPGQYHVTGGTSQLLPGEDWTMCPMFYVLTVGVAAQGTGFGPACVGAMTGPSVP